MPNGAQPILNTSWESTQQYAKDQAAKAIKAGSPAGLTALGKAYYHTMRYKKP
ncbi:MAG: hypothetical protein VXX44_01115 [Bacteroidota bacterium]|nr:hypothetical protein [Bacteroidota bacterium]